MFKKNRDRARTVERILATADDPALAITPADMSIISLALQSRVRDEHAAGRHPAAEAAMVTLTKLETLRKMAR